MNGFWCSRTLFDFHPDQRSTKCRVDGSCSATVVNIKCRWLHGDLFQDIDIDISDNTKLSPGAEQIKNWVDKGNTGTEAEKRTDYAKILAYPTAFVVAAVTVLKVCDTRPHKR